MRKSPKKCAECGAKLGSDAKYHIVLRCEQCRWFRAHGYTVAAWREWQERQARIEHYAQRAAAGLPLFGGEEGRYD